MPGAGGEMSDRIVVVGGGLAGIAAAFGAADGGAEVVLLERRRRLGGLTWSFERHGRSFDNGQHVFLRCCTAYLALLERIGVAHQVRLQHRLDLPVLEPGRRPARIRRVNLPAPLHLAPALAGYRPVPLLQRVGLLPAMRALEALDLDDPLLDQETFAHWLARHRQGARAIEALWDLIVLPTVNLHAQDASLLLAATVFRTGLLASADAGDIGWSTVPLSELHDHPARRELGSAGVEVCLEAPVARVSAGDGWSVVTGGRTVDAGAVIVATPPEVAAAIVPAEARLPQVEALGASPIVNVAMVFDRPVTDLPCAAVLGSPLQFLFAHDGGTRLTISLSAADRWIGCRSDDLVATMREALGAVLPEVRGASVVDAVVTREHRATFRGVPGTAALRPPAATAVDGLYLAGAWTATGWPATMEGAVRSGVEAAALALRHLGRGPSTASHRAQPEPPVDLVAQEVHP